MGQDATEIVKTADARMRGKTSQALITIQTVRPGWTREMKVKTWMKGTDLAMILIQSPAKEIGIVYLKRRKEVWNWLPSLVIASIQFTLYHVHIEVHKRKKPHN